MEIIKFSQKNLRKVVKRAKESIKKGEVLVSPTDTVYGLLADAKNERAVKKIFKIKKRPGGKPIPIFVKNIKMAKNLAFIDKNQEKFLKKFWPGKLTVVFKRKNKLTKILFGREKTIGLRIPNYKLVNLLLEKLNLPLTGTSANISGKPATTKIKEVLRQFQEFQPDLVIDAGNLPKSKPSTVIDLTKKKPKILRKGAISFSRKLFSIATIAK